ncbi:MAG: hypothetical protein MJ093_01715 [Saccharofermentans sp.]|nr:hypothetical protein [Saccharofermentans sp.]
MARNRKRNMTSENRMGTVFIGVIIFIILVSYFIYYEMNSNLERVKNLYINEQTHTVSLLRNYAMEKESEGIVGQDLVQYLPSVYDASGDNFLVYEENGEILFAKTIMATDSLGQLRNSELYWEELNKQELVISSESWDREDVHCTIYIVTLEQSIYQKTNLNKHSQFVFMATVLLCVVLFSLLITYVGVLNRTERSLADTSTKLKESNKNIENYIQMNQDTHIVDDEKFETKYRSMNQFYDPSVLRNLLSKSNEGDLKPVYLVIINFKMFSRYYSLGEISDFAAVIMSAIKYRELLFELRKGTFGVAIYHSSDSEARLRAESFISLLNKHNKEKKIFEGFTYDIEVLGAGEDAPIEDFEKVMEKVEG